MDQSLIADAELDLAQGGPSALFRNKNLQQKETLAVYDQELLDAVERALLRGNNTRSQILKEVPGLNTLQNAEAYIYRIQVEFRETADGVDRDSERTKMVKVLWDVVRESYEALDREKKSDEPKTGAVASILKNIIAAESRISTLLGLNAPQQIDMRLMTLIQELGPDAIDHYKKLKGIPAGEILDQIIP